MKIIATIISLLFTSVILAQVSLKIVKEANNTTYYYPYDSAFTISEDSGERVEFGTGSVIDFDGDYTIKIKTTWNENADSITSDNGKLSLSYEKVEKVKIVALANAWKELRIIKKVLTPSEENTNRYNLVTTFSNGLTFSCKNGMVKAHFDGKELEVVNGYEIVTPEGNIEISFDTRSGEVSQVLKS